MTCAPPYKPLPTLSASSTSGSSRSEKMVAPNVLLVGVAPLASTSVYAAEAGHTADVRRRRPHIGVLHAVTRVVPMWPCIHSTALPAKLFGCQAWCRSWRVGPASTLIQMSMSLPVQLGCHRGLARL